MVVIPCVVSLTVFLQTVRDLEQFPRQLSHHRAKWPQAEEKLNVEPEVFSALNPKPSQTIQPNSIPNTLFAPTFPSPEISFLTWGSGCSQYGEAQCKSERKSVTQKGGGASPAGLAAERVKSLLFTEWAIMGVWSGEKQWRAPRERENPLWIPSAEHKRADCKV